MGSTSESSGRQHPDRSADEAVLRAALEALTHAVLVGGGDGAIWYRNRRAKDLCGEAVVLADLVGGAAALARILRLCRRPDEQVHCSPGSGPMVGRRLCIRTLAGDGPNPAIMIEIDPAEDREGRSIRLHGRLQRQAEMLRAAVEEKRAEHRRRIELERSNQVLRERVLLDPLTGVRNRRGFDADFELALRERQRAPGPLALAIVDVDWFKLVNDEFGHLRGDDYLRRIAEALGTCCRRPRDVVARLGGDEFVCLLPRTDEPGARALALELRRSVARLALPAPGDHAIVSITVGVCVALGDGHPGPAQLLEIADLALYDAKRAGRDRQAVRCWTGLGFAGGGLDAPSASA